MMVHTNFKVLIPEQTRRRMSEEAAARPEPTPEPTPEEAQERRGDEPEAPAGTAE